MGQPIIFAGLNYRLHGGLSLTAIRGMHRPHFYTAFGFLGGKEIKEAGVSNLGLHDRASPLVFPIECLYSLNVFIV